MGKDKKLFMRRFLLRSEFNGHNIGNNDQNTSNPEQSSSNLGAIQYFIKLIRSHFEKWSNAIASTMLTIAATKDFVNASRFRLINPGAINTTPNQPADRLPLIPDRTRKNDFLTAVTLANVGINYN